MQGSERLSIAARLLDMRKFWYFIGIVAFAFMLWGIKFRAGKTELPRQLLLTSATNEWKAATFSLTKGDHYNLVLGLPRGTEVKAGEFLGNVALLHGSRVLLEVPFDVVIATPASWLMNQNLDAYILTWPTNSAPTRLDAIVEPGRSYTVTISFSNGPPPVGSLWLTYLQEWRYRKERGEGVTH